jgi:transporter family protein
MNTAVAYLIAVCAALFMVTLVRTDISSSLRGAVRTTLVLVLAWGCAYSRYGWMSWSGLTWQIQWMLALSALDLGLAWLLWLRAGQTQNMSRGATIDRVNVAFAVLFAFLLWSSKDASQSPLFAPMLIAGAVILAFSRR